MMQRRTHSSVRAVRSRSRVPLSDDSALENSVLQCNQPQMTRTSAAQFIECCQA